MAYRQKENCNTDDIELIHRVSNNTSLECASSSKCDSELGPMMVLHESFASFSESRHCFSNLYYAEMEEN